MKDDPANEDEHGATRIEVILSRRDPFSARRRAAV